MKYQIEVKVKVGLNEFEWKALRPSQGAPYVFESLEKAIEIRRICYPETPEETVRIIKIKNILKTC